MISFLLLIAFFVCLSIFLASILLAHRCLTNAFEDHEFRWIWALMMSPYFLGLTALFAWLCAMILKKLFGIE